MRHFKFMFVVLLFSSLSCGQHFSENKSKSQGREAFQGKKPEDQAGRMAEAINNDKLEDVKAIHQEGFDLNSYFANGRTPLIEATVQLRIPIMVYMLQSGVDPSLKSNEGLTALDYARLSAGKGVDGKPSLTRAVVLLDQQAELAAREQMMRFAGRGSGESLTRLLQESGVSPNFIGENGDTPLTFAVRQNKLIGVQVLAAWTDCPKATDARTCLRLTATNVNMPNRTGELPLNVARKKETPNPAVIEELIRRNAKESLE